MEIVDLSQEKFTQGFGDGYKVGFKQAQELQKNIDAQFAVPKQSAEVDPDWMLKSEDVLVVQDGRIFVGSEVMTADQAKQLKAEAKALSNFHIWRILQESLRQKAIEKAVLQSVNFEQTLSGKLMIHSLGIFKSIVTVLSKYGDK